MRQRVSNGATTVQGVRLTRDERQKAHRLALEQCDGNVSELFRVLLRKAWAAMNRRSRRGSRG